LPAHNRLQKPNRDVVLIALRAGVWNPIDELQRERCGLLRVDRYLFVVTVDHVCLA
jgi:hypothetical protein